MSFIKNVAEKLFGKPCQQLVEYNGKNITFSGGITGISGSTIEIASLSSKIKQLTAVPDIMISMDNMQFLLCMECHKLKNDHPLKELLIRIRLGFIISFCTLHALVSTAQANPHQEVTAQIVEWIEYMSDTVKKTAEEILTPLQPPNYAKPIITREEDSVTVITHEKDMVNDTDEERDRLRESSAFLSEAASVANNLEKYNGTTKEETQEAIKIFKA